MFKDNLWALISDFNERSTINNKYKWGHHEEDFLIFWFSLPIFLLCSSLGWLGLPRPGGRGGCGRGRGVCSRQPPLGSSEACKQGTIIARSDEELLIITCSSQLLSSERLWSIESKVTSWKRHNFKFPGWSLTLTIKIHKSIVVLDVWTNHLCDQTTAKVFYILICEETFKTNFLKLKNTPYLSIKLEKKIRMCLLMNRNLLSKVLLR